VKALGLTDEYFNLLNRSKFSTSSFLSVSSSVRIKPTGNLFLLFLTASLILLVSTPYRLAILSFFSEVGNKKKVIFGYLLNLSI